jgi:exopolysaccharide biosynthesis polyprenyl glycosylphosphotransferase
MLAKIERAKIWLAIGDVVVLNIAYIGSLLLHFTKGFDKPSIGSDGPFQILIFNFITIVWVWILQVHGLYKRQGFLSIARQIVDLLRSSLIGTSLITLIAFFSRSLLIDNSRLVLGYFGIFNFTLLVLWRIIIFRKLYFRLAKSELINYRVLIVGAGNSGRFLAANIQDREIDAMVVGFLDDFKQVDEVVFRKYKVLGKIDDIKSVIDKFDVNRVIIALSNVSHDRLMDIIHICCIPGVNLRIYSDLYNVIASKTEIEEFSKIPLIDITGIHLTSTTYTIKRFLDLMGSLFGLLLLSPFMLLITLLIKITSPGPIIYIQKRIGKNGKEFDFYKFRSMRLGSDNPKANQVHKEFVEKLINAGLDEGQNHNSYKQNNQPRKIVNDPRITWIGRIIRKTSLDELPQLYNVLKGDMSLVGPRPCLPYEYEKYLDWHKERLTVLPGCTGLWQVTGRSEVSFNDMVILDFYYINNMSPWFDLQLILKTFPVMFFGKGGF